MTTPTKQSAALAITQIQPRDEQLVFDFFHRLRPTTIALFHPHPFSRLFVKKMCQVEDQKYHIRLAAKQNGHVVGYAFLTIPPLFPSHAYFGVGVDDQFHGQGIGTKLLTQLFQVAKQRRIHQIHLNVALENKAAFHLYQKMGFAEIGIPFLMSKLFAVYELWYAGQIGQLFQDVFHRVISQKSNPQETVIHSTSLWMVKSLDE